MTVFAKGQNKYTAQNLMANTQWSFEENKGQLADENGNVLKDIKYYGKDKGVSLYCGNGKLSFVFLKVEKQEEVSEATGLPALRQAQDDNVRLSLSKPETVTASRMDLVLINANPNAFYSAENQQEFYKNYYLAHTGENGITNVHTFMQVTYHNVYPNIDMVLHAQPVGMKYEFLVHAGGKVSDIKLQWNGTNNMTALADGGIKYENPLGEMTESKPVSFAANKATVASAFEVNGNMVSFKVGDYDKKGDLEIDPSLIWGTYYGGSSDEAGQGVKSDTLGNVYITGYTMSTSGIASSGAHQTSFGGGLDDAFLAKFNSSGIRIWATYYGGSDEDASANMGIDNSGFLYITGITKSSSAIATSGAFQTSYGGAQDAFLAKFNSSGIRQWGTYYGGSAWDRGWALSPDRFGNVFMSAESRSSTGIATSGAFQASNGGSADAVLAKFNSSGNRIWATYLGGGNDEYGLHVCSNYNGEVYISGLTYSSSGISSSGAHQTSLSGGKDGFLAKFDSSGARKWSTYYGGSSDDEANGVVVDNSGNIYISGYTSSNSNIATSGAYQISNAGSYDAYIAKFNGSGIRLWGTYFGGSSSDGCAQSNSVDKLNNIFVSGITSSSSGIASSSAFQTSFGGGTDDAFFAKFDSTGSRVWSSYFGGSGEDRAYGINADKVGNAYLVGMTTSTSKIATSGTQQSSYAGAGGYGYGDAFLAKFTHVTCRSGTYTIGGTSPDYSTFTDAISALKAGGICGPVTFKVRNGKYNEQIQIPKITGSSSTNTITFVSENGDSSKAVLSWASSSSSVNNYTLNLSNARYVTFSKLGIQRTGSDDYQHVIVLSDSARYDTIRSCMVVGATNNHNLVNQANIYNYDYTAKGNAFIGNYLLNGVCGVYLKDCGKGLVSGNNIDSFEYAGIYADGVDTTLMARNTIFTDKSYARFGIYHYYTAGNITYNKIHMTGDYGIYADLTTASLVKIYNNMVSMKADNAGSTGIKTHDCKALVAYNNILIYGGYNTTSAALAADPNWMPVEAYNNNYMNMAGGYTISIGGYGTPSNYKKGNNNYFSNGLDVMAYNGSAYSSYSSYSSLIGSNNTFVNPGYTSLSDLHAGNRYLREAGVNVSGISDDIDGKARNSNGPTIGANELTDTATTCMSGTYTIGGSNPNFNNMVGAISAMYKRGLCGAVTFNIRDGVYEQQFSIFNKIKGVSATNSITFNGQSGDSSKVIVTSESNTNVNQPYNYTFLLDSSRYVTFKNMTFKRYGTGDYAYVGRTNDYTKNITFSHCGFYGKVAVNEPKYTLFYSSTSADSNLTFNGCRFKSGGAGIVLSASSSKFGYNLTVKNCMFDSMGSSDVSARYFDGVLVDKNYMDNTSWFEGAAVDLKYNKGNLAITHNNITCTGNSYLDYGILTQYNTCKKTNPMLIANNMVVWNAYGQVCCISSSVDSSVNIYNNSTLVRGSGTTGINLKIFQSYGSNTRVMNNVLQNDQAYYCYYGNSSSGATLVTDYNNLYTNTTYFANWNYTDYGSMSSFRTAIGGETKSRFQQIWYKSNSDLHATGVGLNNWGTSLASITDDIDGEARSSTPDVGADEYTPVVAYDCGVVKINSPNDSTCPQTASVKVTLRNYGTSTLTNAKITWSVNGSTIGTNTWTGSLAALSNIVIPITLGNYNLVANNTYTFKIWTSLPNGKTDSNAVNDTLIKKVKVFPFPNCIVGTNKSICPGNSASIGGTAVAGSTYQWFSNPVGFNSTSSSAVVSPTITTVYYLTEKNSGNCLKTDSVTITVSQPPIADAGSDQTVCAGTGLWLGSNVYAGYKYAWTSSPAGFTSTNGAPYIYPTITRTYYLTVTDTATLCFDKDTVVITVNPLPSVSAGADKTICNSGSVSIGSNAVSGHTYYWSSSPSGFTSTSSKPTVSPTATTTYYLTETITNTGCYSSDTVKVTVNPAPSANVGTAKTICKGSSTQIGANTVVGSTYAWTSNPAGFTSSLSKPTVTPAVTTTYYLTETTTLTGCTKSDSVKVTVNPIPSANVGAAKSVCKGGSVGIGATAVSGNTYAWTSNPTGFSSTVSNPNVTPTITTTYILTETITATGCFKKDSVVVTVNPLPNATVGTAKSICYLGSTQIGGTGVSGNTYAWTSNPIGFASSLANPVVSPTLTTTYYLTEKVTATGCTKSDSVKITVNPLPNANVGSPKTFCAGGSTTIGAAKVTGNTYSWTSNPSGFTSTLANPTVSPTTTTTYKLAETITATGCSKTDSVTITVNPLPSANTGGNKSICYRGSGITLGATAVSGNTYSWISKPTGFTSTSSKPFVNPLTKTIYYLTETNTSTGCTKSDSATITIKKCCMSGVYTIGGTTPDFTTFTEAVDALEYNGVCGAVTFKVREGSYNEQIKITSINGASRTNTITFQGEKTDSSKAVLYYSSKTFGNGNYLIELDSADFITFKGLTLQRTDKDVNGIVAVIKNGAKGNSFLNNRILGVKLYSSTSQTLIYSYTSSDSGTVIKNNLMKFGNYGIMLRGLSYNERGTVIDHNALDSLYTYSIEVEYQYGCRITNNTISSGLNDRHAAIYVYGSDSAFFVSGNKISLPSGGYGININSCNLFSNVPGIVANNFITINSVALAPSYGLYSYYSNYTNMVFNNVYLKDNYASSMAGYMLNSKGGITENNNFISGGKALAYGIQSPTNFTSDYNNFLSSGSNLCGYGGTNYGTLKAFQTACGTDKNSMNENPYYTSSSDLHVKNPVLDGAAKSISSITDDIDGETRNASTPDIGADEFNASANDAGITAITQPDTIVCEGTSIVYATLKNWGSDTLKTVKINWTVNGTSQTSYNWKGTLLSKGTVSVKVGSFNFVNGTNYAIKTWTSNPNGSADGFVYNDTFWGNTIKANARPKPSAGGKFSVCAKSIEAYLTTSNKGSSYSWTATGGSIYSGNGTNAVQVVWGTGTTGKVKVVETNSLGCSDSSEITITINPLPLAKTINDTSICNGTSLYLGATAVKNHVYSWTSTAKGWSSTLANPLDSPKTTTTYYLTEKDTITGCSSSDSVTVKVNFANGSSYTVKTCDSYVFDGKTLTKSGTYYATKTNQAGCDSVITLNLTINKSNGSTAIVKACDSYVFGGNTLTKSGTYYDTLMNVGGCDSILTLKLTINKSNGSTSTVKACDSFVFGGNTLTSSGVYYDTLTNVSGCDSILTLNLTINKSNSNTIAVSACNSYFFNGNTITTSGTYYDTLVNSSGCDSFLTLNLTINKSNGSSASVKACNSYSFGGNTLTNSGVYYDTLTNVSGCDSVLTLNLTINKSDTSTISISACDSFVFNGNTLTSSGTYYDTLSNMHGCDSFITLNLTIDTLSNLVTLTGKTLTATQSGATYQWLDCNNGNAKISGATNQSYTATKSGDYAVALTKNSCVDTSSCINITVTGTDELRISNYELWIYPNPTKGLINLEFSFPIKEDIEMKVYDMIGQLCHTEIVEIPKPFDKLRVTHMQIDLSGKAKGVYLIECVGRGGVVMKRVVLE